jgi:predicted PurR-regulated permease PerM
MVDEAASDREPVEARHIDVVAVLLAAFAILTFLYLVHIVLLPFVVAGAAAYILTPAVDWLARKSGAPRRAMALLVFAVLVAIIGGTAYLTAPLALAEAAAALTHLQDILQRMLQRLLGEPGIQLLGQQTSAADLASSLVASLRGLMLQAGNAATLSGWAFGGVFGLFLTLTLLAYFLMDGRRILHGLLWLFPPSWRPRTARIMLDLHPILLRYFVGVAVVIVYASVAAYLGLAFFLGLRHAAFLAALTGVFEVLPVAGPALAAILAGLVALQEAKGISGVIDYVIYASALRLSIDQLVGPIVLGRAARINPPMVIFCFLAGGVLFGIVGVILAVPTALAIKVALSVMYREPFVGPLKSIASQSE